MSTKSRLAPLIAFLVFAGAPAAFAQRGGSVEKHSYHFEEAGVDIEYALYVPGSYRKAEPAPLLVLLHGLGSNPRQVMRYAGITEEAEKRGYIVVAPFGYNERGWYGSLGKGPGNPFLKLAGDPENIGELSEKDVMNVLGIVREEFEIDASRIYLMGHSMGGGGTVHLGSKYPDIWAALAPLSPALHGDPAERVRKMKHIPTFIVTGEKDRLVQVADVRRWVAKMEEMKVRVRYKEIPGGNHIESITRNPKMIAEVFEFFDRQRRGGVAGAVGGGDFRDFTNRAGRTIRAKVVRLAGDQVSIMREDGKGFTVPVDSLSEADQAYLRAWSK